jgi:hypothetical protein
VRLFGFAHMGLAKLLPRRGWIEAVELPPGIDAPKYEVGVQSSTLPGQSGRLLQTHDGSCCTPCGLQVCQLKQHSCQRARARC